MRTRCFVVLLMMGALPGSIRGDEGRPSNENKLPAGSYYRGDGLGLNCTLDIDGEGRFTSLWTGCLGVYDRNEGTAAMVDGRLVLHPERPDRLKSLATEYVPVRWGERTYLIPKGDGQPRAASRGTTPTARTTSAGEIGRRQ